ncbi:hypothetical protein [Bacillus piscicola]|uniref:hypothetical protein n=1 Tax=Bacillus piscicola TaxID=1632684 RepID=UPI001F08BEF9|nr:hypothetical protein [Bacillus piscicola]
MDFLTADRLKGTYSTEASFYNFKTAEQTFACRDFVHIYENDNRQIDRFDAIFTLANPGLCSPAETTYDIPHVVEKREYQRKYIPAKTDNTQYQIMRLMHVRKWCNVLVINLSDIRCGNLKDFRIKLKEAEKAGFTSHSIFATQRKQELTHVLDQCAGPVIAAWGTNPVVKELAEKAIHALPAERVTGVLYEKRPFYYHASPQPKGKKLEWLRSMARELA